MRYNDTANVGLLNPQFVKLNCHCQFGLIDVMPSRPQRGRDFPFAIGSVSASNSIQHATGCSMSTQLEGGAESHVTGQASRQR